MRNADKTIANTEAIPDNKGLMSIVTQLIIVERKVAPTDSVLVITQREVVEVGNRLHSDSLHNSPKHTAPPTPQ